MSEMSTKILREAQNNVYLCGILKEKNLRELTSDKGEFISGDIIVMTKDGSEHKVMAFANRMTKGTPDKPSTETGSYKSLKAAMDLPSIAELMLQGASLEEAKAKAAKVRLNAASLGLNEYYGRDDQLVSFAQINSNFISRLSDVKYEEMPEEETKTARFDIVGFLDKMTPENRNGNETGRYYVDLIVPVYGGAVKPMRFVTTPEAGEYMERHYEPHRTIHVYGDIVNTVKIVETRVEGFMKAEVEHRETRVREMIINNGAPEPYAEDNEYSYNEADIRRAMQIRETEYLPNLFAKQKARSANRLNGNTAPAKKPFTF